MPDFIDDLLSEEPGEESPPTPSSGGEGRKVETALAPRLPSPASLARRTVGNAVIRKHRFKKLSQRHKLIIGMHLNGRPHRDIAQEIGCSTAIVQHIIKDPLAQEVITYYYEGVEEELKALLPEVVETVRAALTNNSIDTRLKGVDRFAKLTGMGGEGSGEKVIDVKVVVDARARFVQEIRAEAGKMIEGKAEEVVEDVVDVSDS